MVRTIFGGGPPREKCGQNSVGGHFEIGCSQNRQSGEIVISSLVLKCGQFKDNLGKIIHL